MILFRLLVLPLRVGHRVGRLVGYRRVVVFAAGVGVGLLVAPTTGAALRSRIGALLEERRRAGGDLAAQVRYDLAHSPRTWHLPQPEVEVVGSTAILRGEVPHEVGKADLERAAAAVPGVAGVESLLAISGTNGHR